MTAYSSLKLIRWSTALRLLQLAWTGPSDRSAGASPVGRWLEGLLAASRLIFAQLSGRTRPRPGTSPGGPPARRQELEASLRTLPLSEFRLIYQPQVDPLTGRIMGVEALLRWHHPRLGPISPTEFIPVAEETGMIIPITEWVMHTACAQSRAWIDAGLPPIRMAVNLSARHFAPAHSAGLLRCVSQQLEAFMLPPELLELEITETLPLESLDSAAEVVEALTAMGVGLAIDDFGAGFSSLRYLKRFSLHTVKIDRSFIQDVDTSHTSRTIVESVLSMSRALGVQVVAEGVETDRQLEFLNARGCPVVQGFYFSRPVSAEEIAVLLRTIPSPAAESEAPEAAACTGGQGRAGVAVPQAVLLAGAAPFEVPEAYPTPIRASWREWMSTSAAYPAWSASTGAERERSPFSRGCRGRDSRSPRPEGAGRGPSPLSADVYSSSARRSSRSSRPRS